MTNEKNRTDKTQQPGKGEPQTTRIKEENLGDARSDRGAADTTPENYGNEKAPNPGHPV